MRHFGGLPLALEVGATAIAGARTDPADVDPTTVAARRTVPADMVAINTGARQTEPADVEATVVVRRTGLA